MRFSLLDRSRIRHGEADGDALAHSMQRAIDAEALGYHRFWAAEHHAVPGIASGSPAVLLGAVGQRTTRIRLGSGGVMLPDHRPLVVAEQFLMLEALLPGRVDLGLGRSLGFTTPVREALGRLEATPDQFGDEIRQVREFLEGTASVTARPVVASPPPVFVLATGSGLVTAARSGLPVVVGGPVLAADDLPGRLERYRAEFRSHRGSRPYVVLSADVLVGDTDAQARELALPEVWAMVASRETGVFPPLESVAAIRAKDVNDRQRRRIEQGLDSAWAGRDSVISARIGRLMERTRADELLLSGCTEDRAALAESDRRLAAMLR
jgi:luciferase family oxidoreductase group 1